MGRRILTCAFVMGATIVASGVLAGSVTAAHGTDEMGPQSIEPAKLIAGGSVVSHAAAIRGSVAVGEHWGADYRWYLAQKRLALHRSVPAADRVASSDGAVLAPSIGLNF